MDKKSAAYILFREGYKQGDIAKLLGVSEQAIPLEKEYRMGEKSCCPFDGTGNNPGRYYTTGIVSN